ncbi:MAG: hypothetical protein Q9205_007950, partial [Flavoplaca limonia]
KPVKSASQVEPSPNLNDADGDKEDDEEDQDEKKDDGDRNESNSKDLVAAVETEPKGIHGPKRTRWRFADCENWEREFIVTQNKVGHYVYHAVIDLTMPAFSPSEDNSSALQFAIDGAQPDHLRDTLRRLCNNSKDIARAAEAILLVPLDRSKVRMTPTAGVEVGDADKNDDDSDESESDQSPKD